MNNIVSFLKGQSWIQELLENGNVYLVGGCVRDMLMNTPVKDIDIVVEGPSMDSIKSLLKHYGRVDIVGQSFAVIKFRPIDHTGPDYDIAVPRIDRKVGTGHKGFEVETEGVDILSDLKRRDFTINSIAINIKTGFMLDPFNGANDINNKILKATDSRAFAEDPLRIMRAIQFASRFNFDVDNNTLLLMKKHSKEIKSISGERILEEFVKLLAKTGSTKRAIHLIHDTNLDVELMGQKFNITNGIDQYLDNLDPISFFYILSELSGVNSVKFYKERLKGDAHMSKALFELNKILSKQTDSDTDMLRWDTFMMIKASPMIKDCKILPGTVKSIIKKMNNGLIPMKLGDIPVNGNDIMTEFGLKDEDVGNVIAKMYFDALNNQFNWKDKTDTLNYLHSLNSPK